MIPGAEVPNCVDIRDAVYLRMAPSDIREEVGIRRAVSDELEAKIFARMFPAMTEEAIFWYQAGKGRGLVLCEGASIKYVPQQNLSEVLPAEDRSKADAALANYDPHREGVIAIVRGEFLGLAVTGPGAADPVLQLIQ